MTHTGNHIPVARLKEQVARRPGDAQAWYDLGVAAAIATAQGGDAEEAREALMQAALLAPADVTRALRVARQLTGLGFIGDAEVVLRQALQHDPRHTEARLTLIEVLLSGNPEISHEEAAQAEVTRALQDAPRNLELRLIAADLAERRGALAEAADHLAAVLAVEAGHVEGNRRLGVILGQLGDTRGAVRCWRKVAGGTGGQDLDALTMLGIGLSSDGQHSEAVQTLQHVAVRRRDSSAAHANLGMALLAAGRVDQAVAALRRALSLDNNSAQAHCGLGLAYQKQGKFTEAATAFRTTERLAPDNAVPSLNLGLVLEAVGDREGARRALLRAAALEPEDEEIRLTLEDFLARHSPRESSPTPPPPFPDGGATPVPVTGQEISGPLDVTMKGDLKSFQLFDVLEFLRLQAKSGALMLSSRKGAGIIRLVGGRVTSASAPGVKRLGEVLVERGHLKRADLEAALSKQRGNESSGRKGRRTLLAEDRDAANTLGVHLLAAGLVKQDVLGRVVLDQVMATLTEVTSWTEGRFSFHDSLDDAAPPVSFDLQEVMLEFVRTSDERRRDEPEPLSDDDTEELEA